ncbi:L,D-transpeptidase family protein [Streptomyces sp. NPDC001780]
MRTSSKAFGRGRRAGLWAALAVALSAGCTVQPGMTGPGGPATDQKPGERPAWSAPTYRAATPSRRQRAVPPSKAVPVAPRTPLPRTLMASGASSAQVRELQARLRQIGHFHRTPTGYYGSVTAAAVGSFQNKRGLPRTGRTDVVTWARLLAMTEEPTGAELRPPTRKPAVRPAAGPKASSDPRCMTGRVMCISKSSGTLSWMVDGSVMSTMDVRFGSQYTPTREGTFSVYWKSRDHVSTLYDTAMPYAMFFSGGQAVHYSADFAARGYTGASHGCVNVRDKQKIAALFSQVSNGDKVVIY